MGERGRRKEMGESGRRKDKGESGRKKEKEKEWREKCRSCSKMLIQTESYYFE